MEKIGRFFVGKMGRFSYLCSDIYRYPLWWYINCKVRKVLETMLKRLLNILIALVFAVPVFAQEHDVEHRLVVDIPFVLAGDDESDIRHDIDSAALRKSMRELESIAKDKRLHITAVEFYSSVSPEGSYSLNRQLSAKRLATAERIIRGKLNIDKSVPVKYTRRFIPWREYLLPAILADKDIPYRDTLLKIVSREPKPYKEDRRRKDLMSAYDGKLYDIVRERYFDYIRRGGAIITAERRVFDALLADTAIFQNPIRLVEFGDLAFEKIQQEVEPVLEPAQSESLQEPVVMDAVSIKTNAASVAALITNIGFEVKLAPRWSLDVMGAYSPYNMVVKNRKIRVFGARPEVRFWWGDVMKRGHFVGLHGFTSAFNVQLGDKSRYQDPNHALWGVGLAYGYALPLGKKERWGVEFTVGFGYARAKYDRYDGAINGQFIERKTINYFGPTRLGIDFSYRFDIERKNRGKK